MNCIYRTWISNKEKFKIPSIVAHFALLLLSSVFFEFLSCRLCWFYTKIKKNNTIQAPNLKLFSVTYLASHFFKDVQAVFVILIIQRRSIPNPIALQPAANVFKHCPFSFCIFCRLVNKLSIYLGQMWLYWQTPAFHAKQFNEVCAAFLNFWFYSVKRWINSFFWRRWRIHSLSQVLPFD